ncbi:Ankyrin repeat and SOCS box protein 3 [Merluccius polli]|uniref:Ankyrin repeat and SOCS box protein 3 n=1 Tax=Merluccius polli TaxID=89951 RepID=A0AA47M8Q3_MERPO|nr:Ankyrin repeat and SOCS box protein 3 [Merluccius polli]
MYVNMKARKGQTALFLAAAKGHVDIVKLLVTAGANMNIKNASGLTPILAALSKNKPAVAKVLLRKGAEVNQTVNSRQSCLHLASAQGSSELVSILLQICSIEFRNKQEKTAIYLAAENGHQECVEILACAGANVDVRVMDCSTPLMAATRAQSEECVEVLLKYGADPHVACCIPWPQLPIHAAASLKNVNILKRLVAATSREVSYAAGHASPVYEAVQQPEMLDVLLSEGFSPEAQPWDDCYDVDSPLALVLLMRAGARLTHDCWKMCLEDIVILDLLLDERCEAKGKGPGATRLLDGEEVEALQSVAALCSSEADYWLPALLKSGLDPAALLVPDFLMAAESDTLTYLLEMVNWSTLTRPLRHVLEQRQKLKTWTCPAHLESVPPLFHLCRLQLRTYLGPDVLMRSDVVSQLPVPSLLHGYLRFADITLPHTS